MPKELVDVATRSYIARMMMRAGIRDLKNNLSHYLRRVRKGERILVTDRGEVIAELRPPPEASGDPAMSRYQELIASGVIRPGAGGDPFAAWPNPGEIRLPPGTVQQLIDEDRDEP